MLRGKLIPDYIDPTDLEDETHPIANKVNKTPRSKKWATTCWNSGGQQTWNCMKSLYPPTFDGGYSDEAMENAPRKDTCAQDTCVTLLNIIPCTAVIIPCSILSGIGFFAGAAKDLLGKYKGAPAQEMMDDENTSTKSAPIPM